MELSRYSSISFTQNQGVYHSGVENSVSYPASGNMDSFKLEESSFWFRHRNNCILRILKAGNVTGPLFDVGGGNGFVSAFLEKNGFETVLIEPGVSGAMNAAKRKVSFVINGTLEDCHFHDNSLPAVGMFDVLEHIENDRQFLGQVIQKMSPGGHLILTVPAHQWLWSNDDQYAGHFRRYTHHQLTSILKEAGFEVVICWSNFFFLIAPIYFLRSLPSRKGKVTQVEEHERNHSPSRLSRLIVDFVCLIDDLMMRLGLKWGASLVVLSRKKK